MNTESSHNNWCLTEGVETSHDWFGRQLTIDAIGSDEAGRYIAHFRTKVVLGTAEGLTQHLTHITIVLDSG